MYVMRTFQVWGKLCLSNFSRDGSHRGLFPCRCFLRFHLGDWLRGALPKQSGGGFGWLITDVTQYFNCSRKTRKFPFYNVFIFNREQGSLLQCRSGS